MQLPKVSLKESEIPCWTAIDNGGVVLILNEDKRPILAVSDKQIATLILSLPGLLRFVASCMRNVSNPVAIPAETMLKGLNVELFPEQLPRPPAFKSIEECNAHISAQQQTESANGSAARQP